MITFATRSAAVVPATEARLPQAYEAAKQALATCASIDECQTWADKAAALASYAKQAKDEEMMKQATRIRDRAIRRAGELLKQIEPANGANQNISVGGHTKVESRKDVAAEAGLSKHQQVQAIRVANLPEAEFERQVESANPPTVTKLAEQGKKTAPALAASPVAKAQTPQPIIDLKGRDPAEFNRSLHFVAEFEEYAEALSGFDLEKVLPGLTTDEAARVRTAIGKIDAIHDRIATRI